MSSTLVRSCGLALVLLTSSLRRAEAQQPATRSPGDRVARQLAGGFVGAVVGSLTLALIGAKLEPECSCDDPGLTGFIYGGVLGAALGPALPVHAIGNQGPERGSLPATMFGGALGTGVFLALGPALDDNLPLFLMSFWGLPAAGAAAGYHLSARPRDPAQGVRLSLGLGGERGRPALVGTLSF